MKSTAKTRAILWSAVLLALVLMGGALLPRLLSDVTWTGEPAWQPTVEASAAPDTHAESGMTHNTFAYNGEPGQEKRTGAPIRAERRTNPHTSGSDRYAMSLWSKRKAAARRLLGFLVRRDIRASSAIDRRRIYLYTYRPRREDGLSRSDSSSDAHLRKEDVYHPLLDM